MPTAAHINDAADLAAAGRNTTPMPTPAQHAAGNYRKGRFALHGLLIAIENPMGSIREGVGADGVPWRNRMAAHYGYFSGTRGADGDPVDVFVGGFPDAADVWVINQVDPATGAFDEHKVMLGFASEAMARAAYNESYTRDWAGLGSMVRISVPQLKWWLRHGSKSAPVTSPEGVPAMPPSGSLLQPVRWTEGADPVGKSVGRVLYDMQFDDAHDGLLTDPMTMADLLTDPDITEVMVFDALVVEVGMLQHKAQQLMTVMQAAGDKVKPQQMEVGEPVKLRGTMQVPVIYGMSDGQTLTIWFHNPDTTPAKLTPMDTLVSARWVINKKDVTIVVAPEKGQDLKPREVARRIMKLVDANSAAFARANAKAAETASKIDGLKGEIAGLQAELGQLNRKIAEAEVMKVDRAAKPVAAPAAPAQAPEPPSSPSSQFQIYANWLRKQAAEGKAIPENFWRQVAMDERLNDGEAEVLKADHAERPAVDLAALHVAPEADPVASAAAPTNVDAPAMTREQIMKRRRDQLADVVATGKENNGGVLLTLRPKALQARRDELAKVEAELEAASRKDASIERNMAVLKMAREDLAKQVPGSAGWMRMFRSVNEMESLLRELGADQSDTAAAPVATDPPIPAPANDTVAALTAMLTLGWERRPSSGYVVRSWPALGLIGGAVVPDGTRNIYSRVEGGDIAAHLGDEELARVTVGADAAAAAAELNAKVEAWVAVEQAKWRADAETRRKPKTPQGVAETPAAATTTADLLGDTGPAPLAPEGAESKVKTAKGTEVLTGYTVVEADSLITSHNPATGDANPAFPAELQPRDRGRDASIAWVRKTAQDLDPDLLGKSRRADSGAPIVGPDGVVESGNGRTMAVVLAYQTGKADDYRAWLTEEAPYFGLKPEKVAAMRRPVLVRVRTSEVDRVAFAVEANQDDKLAMTATEVAKADAGRLTDDVVALMTEDGDLTAAANVPFLAAFLRSLGDAEAARYSTSDGKPTASLIARVQAAIFAKAYQDDRLLELTADVAKPEIANIVRALNHAAPEFIQAAALDPEATGAATGKLTDAVEKSLNQQAVDALLGASNVIRQAKEAGQTVDEFVRQSGLFGDIDPNVAAMAVFISQNNRSAKRMGEAFKAMATFIKGEIQRRQTADMFGDAEPVDFKDIVAAANRELQRLYGEGAQTIGLFDRPDAAATVPAQDPTPATVQPDPTPTTPIVNTAPDPAPTNAAPANPQRAADITFLRAIIDGSSPDMLEPETADRLIELMARHEGDAEVQDLAGRAVDAYQAAAMAATANIR